MRKYILIFIVAFCAVLLNAQRVEIRRGGGSGGSGDVTAAGNNTFTGTNTFTAGTNGIGFFDSGGVVTGKVSRLRAAPNIATNVTIYLPTNAIPGIGYLYSLVDGTLQFQAVNLAANQYVRSDGSGVPYATSVPSGAIRYVGGQSGANNIASATAYHLGEVVASGYNSNQGRYRIIIDKAGTITRFSLFVRVGNAASSEGMVADLRLNNTTTVASLAYTYDSGIGGKSYVTNGLSQAVSVGDYIECRINNAATAMTTPPTSIQFYFYVIVE